MGTSPSHFPFSLQGMSHSWRQQLVPGVVQGRGRVQGQAGWDPEQPGPGIPALGEGGFGTASSLRFLPTQPTLRFCDCVNLHGKLQAGMTLS